MAPFLAVFLDGKGFSSLEIGEILAVVTATKVVGPTIWAMLSDKTGEQVSIVRLGAVLSTISFGVLFFVDGYWPITLFLAIFSLFWNAILPQIEVLTLLSIRKSPKIYARIRLWGSIGFIVLAVVSGELIAIFDSNVYLPIGFLVLVGLIFSSYQISQPKSIKRVTSSASIFEKIFDYRFILFFISGLLLQASFGPYNGFFALYLRDLAYPSYAVGLLISVGVVAEILVFIYAGKFFQVFTIKALLVFSVGISALRWYITAEWGDVALLMVACQLMHAFSFGLYHSASMQFIQSHFNVNQQNRGQALYIGGVFGIGGALGAYLTGVIWQAGGDGAQTFYYASAAAVVALIFMLVLPNKQYQTN